MVRRLARITLLLLTLGGLEVGLAEQSITCTAAIPTGDGVCFWEQPAATLLGFEIAYGVELGVEIGALLRHQIKPEDVLSLAPYLILGSYQEQHAWWFEIKLPAGIIPVIGTTDYLRAGFSYRW